MTSPRIKEAKDFLGGKHFLFDQVNVLWKQLKNDDEIHLARRVLEQIRQGKGLLDEIPPDRAIKGKLCQQHAELTSKDPELSVSLRHDLALAILKEGFDLADAGLDGDGETLGIAGGICKRRWRDLGQYEDLLCAADYYTRGAKGPVGYDGYAHINAAFMQDLLAHVSGAETEAKKEALALREKILADLTPMTQVPSDLQWWNAATRAEALF